MAEIKIYIADDHLMVQDGLKSILSNIEGIQVIGTAIDGKQCLDEVRSGIRPDVILMDIDMPRMSGMDATKLLKQEFPDIKIVGLSMHDERGVIQSLIDVGADGYILKNSSGDELAKGIEVVLKGEKFFSTEVTMKLLKRTEEIKPSATRSKEFEELTEREIEILRQIAEGLSNKEIGEKLFISHRTVDTHRTNLMRKLNVHNIAGLIKFALKNGIIN
ncbi:MAG: DNA-binding response regulator [Crocinitomicaceae bacterium]|nr:DNA-binding response regulator [Crocinitomicaceae bacterium]|tara:strand:- start:301 stop:954 length:654 start_codon:yes stop_codon:yes gene_type:complete